MAFAEPLSSTASEPFTAALAGACCALAVKPTANSNARSINFLLLIMRTFKLLKNNINVSLLQVKVKQKQTYY
jgi:hypothetical protein